MCKAANDVDMYDLDFAAARLLSPTLSSPPPRVVTEVHTCLLQSRLLVFVRQVQPDSGFWKGASYNFTFTIPALYPHDPPKVNSTCAINCTTV